MTHLNDMALAVREKGLDILTFDQQLIDWGKSDSQLLQRHKGRIHYLIVGLAFKHYYREQ